MDLTGIFLIFLIVLGAFKFLLIGDVKKREEEPEVQHREQSTQIYRGDFVAMNASVTASASPSPSPSPSMPPEEEIANDSQ